VTRFERGRDLVAGVGFVAAGVTGFDGAEDELVLCVLLAVTVKV
jgi:hypothetical protein